MIHFLGFALRIHLVDCRPERQQRGGFLLGAALQIGDELEVGLDGAGVFLEVFLVVELDGVDEEADDDEVVLLQRAFDE